MSTAGVQWSCRRWSVFNNNDLSESAGVSVSPNAKISPSPLSPASGSSMSSAPLIVFDTKFLPVPILVHPLMSPVPCIVVECLDKRVDPSREEQQVDPCQRREQRDVAKRCTLPPVDAVARGRSGPSYQFLSRDGSPQEEVAVRVIAWRNRPRRREEQQSIRAGERSKGKSQRGVLFSLATLLREGEVVHCPNS